MKKVLVALIILIIILILLVPVRSQQKDGGTVVYRAILYTVYDMHRINSDPNAPNKFIEGIIVEIFGIEVFNNTK